MPGAAGRAARELARAGSLRLVGRRRLGGAERWPAGIVDLHLGDRGRGRRRRIARRPPRGRAVGGRWRRPGGAGSRGPRTAGAMLANAAHPLLEVALLVARQRLLAKARVEVALGER